MGEDHQQRRCLVVQLDMDLANAFNAPNHRPIIQIIENCGFHPQDVAFVKRMLQNMWVSVGSEVGETAACVLDRGFWQGNTKSPDFQGSSFTSVTAQDGSSDYADDSKLRTDGPDAIPAMQVIANKVDVVLDRIGSVIRHFRVGQHG